MLRVVPAALFAVCAVYAQQDPAPCLQVHPASRPYSLDRLLLVVQNQTAVRAQYLIRTCGVGMKFTKDVENALRKAGADDAVVAAVRDTAPVVQAGQIVTNPLDGLRYVFVPGRQSISCPPHPTIPAGYWVGETEATVGAFKKYLLVRAKQQSAVFGNWRNKHPYVSWGADSHPVTFVDAFIAEDYCKWAGLRLPSNDEWAYAAGSCGPGSFRSENAWYGETGRDSPHPVAGKARNGFGLYDMIGNVKEWTSSPYPELDDARRKLRGRIVRGGSWRSGHSELSAYAQSGANAPGADIGFRCSGGCATLEPLLPAAGCRQEATPQ